MTRFDLIASHDPPSDSEASSSDAPPPGGAPQVGIAFDPAMLLHCACGPERPDRLTAIMAHLEATKVLEDCERIRPRPCSKEEALTVHSEAHWARLMDLPHSPLGAMSMTANENTAEAARLAAGSVVEVTEQVITGRLRSAFAIVRPPGHHSSMDTMQGFCFLNNLAVAARVARRRHGLKRVLVVDWDVHHGNGTQALLEDDPGVMYVSLHRYTRNFFPRTGDPSSVGTGPGAGFTINVPWRRVGMGDLEYEAAFRQVVMPIAAQYDPELVLVSAGYDASHGDPLGEMHLSAGAYGRMVRDLGKLAGGRVVCALEGGYRLRPTAAGVAATIRAMLDPTAVEAAGPCPHVNEAAAGAIARACEQSLLEVFKAHRGYWGVLHSRQPPARVGRAGAEDDQAGLGDDKAQAPAERSTAPVLVEDPSLIHLPSPRAPAPAHKGAQAPLEKGAQADICKSCEAKRRRADFSRSQWKRFPAGGRTCMDCVALHSSSASSADY